jgi:glycerol-3-phosphate cytidylyltransferase
MFCDAKTACDKLVVALQGDPTIDRPQKCKPVQSLEARREILGALIYVDEIVTYDTEAELFELLKTVEYDVRILGTDYRERSYTRIELGKPVYFHERDHDFSTTALKELIYNERLSSKNRSNV